MKDMNKSFCRQLLTSIMPEVKKYLTKETLKKVWVYNYKNSSDWEFHVSKCELFPNGVFYDLQADNNSHAKYHGYSRLLSELKSVYQKYGECFFCAMPATAGFSVHMYVCPTCAEKVQSGEEGYEI